MIDIISVTSENIDKEHICCALSGDEAQSKKQWMKQQFENGLTFKKLNERGKVFIEYIPAENAFAPINAPNYMYINCLWTSGKFKGKGYGSELLKICIEDAQKQNKEGLVILSTKTKKPFMSEASFLKYKGFHVADIAHPYFELLYLPFHPLSSQPKFKAVAKKGRIDEQGIVLYYTHQCPFTEKYVSIIQNLSLQKNVPFKKIRLETIEQAQQSPCPFTTYSLFVNGMLYTNEILTEKKFLQIVDKFFLEYCQD